MNFSAKLFSLWVALSLSFGSAVSIDYRDLDRQAAELANNILAGKSTGKTLFSHPEKIVYTLNTRTMDHLRLEITNDLIKASAKVFE